MTSFTNLSYDPTKIEKHWQKYWLDHNVFSFNVTDRRCKKFVLDMFPYPSGSGLHVGHPRGYTATDIISRMYRLQNFNVLHPIGFDAFGLPAENFARKTNQNPLTFTAKNIKNFVSQLQSLSLDYDYDMAINTSDPYYFQWTQWIFKKLYENKLAVLKKQKVNYCPELHTVLANEEIYLKDNIPYSIRGDHVVEKRLLTQWSLKITAYAERLLSDLDLLDWPNSIKSLQRNWIGKQTGDILSWSAFNCQWEAFFHDATLITTANKIYLAIDHPHVDALIEQFNENEQLKIKTFINDNLASSQFNLNVPYEQVNKILLPIRFNFSNSLVYLCAHTLSHNLAQKIIFTNSKVSKKPQVNFQQYLQTYKISRKAATLYKLQDWLFSRQRFWGEPFPLYYSDDNQIILVDDAKLPWQLPLRYHNHPVQITNNEIKGPLANFKDWYQFKVNEKTYQKDSNTMPQWAGSCWYYLAYLLKAAAKNNYLALNSPQAKALFDKYLPVDLYVGGQEHAVLHLLYARFWHKFLYDLKIVSCKEPFLKLINQGMILANSGEKMSKSKNNVVNPDDLIKKYGSDALRLYEMFLGPINSNLPWDSHGVASAAKFLQRVYRFFVTHSKSCTLDFSQVDNDVVVAYHTLVKNVSTNISALKFNSAISSFMIFLNQCAKATIMPKKHLEGFLIMFSCFCPCLADELWSYLGNDKSIYEQKANIWPQYDAKKLEVNSLPVIVQRNGKFFQKFDLPKDKCSESQLIKASRLKFTTPYDKVIVKKLKNQIIVNFIVL